MYNKKWIPYLFLFSLLFSNIGLAYNIHSCRGNIEKISLAYTKHQEDSSCKMDSEESCCSIPEVKKKNDCCKDDVVTQQPTDKNLVKTFLVQWDHFILPSPWNPLDSLAYIPQEELPLELLFYCDSHAPPLFKLYCQYIFYA